MNKSILVYIYILFISLLTNCNKDISTSENKNLDIKITRENAVDWFNREFSNWKTELVLPNIIPKNGVKTENIKYNIEFDKSKLHYIVDKNIGYLESPVSINVNFELDKHKKSKTIIKHIIERRPDGEMNTFFMILVANESYLIHPDANLESQLYMFKSSIFNGHEFFFDMNGDFISGYKIINGKPKEKFQLLYNNKNNRIENIYCYEQFMPSTTQWCWHVGYLDAQGNFHENYIECSRPYTSQISLGYICNESGGGGYFGYASGGSGGSGGSNNTVPPCVDEQNRYNYLHCDIIKEHTAGGPNTVVADFTFGTHFYTSITHNNTTHTYYIENFAATMPGTFTLPIFGAGFYTQLNNFANSLSNALHQATIETEQAISGNQNLLDEYNFIPYFVNRAHINFNSSTGFSNSRCFIYTSPRADGVNINFLTEGLLFSTAPPLCNGNDD